MTELLLRLIKTMGFSDSVSHIILSVAFAVIAILLAFIADLIARRALLNIISSIAKRTKTKWDDILVEKKVFNKLFNIIPAVVINIFLPLIFSGNKELTLFLQHCTMAYMIGVATTVIMTSLEAANEIYQNFHGAKARPIKGYIQLIQIFTAIVGGLLVITTILNKSPLGILSGIGAMTAVLLLIFRDTILGLVSSIQIGANDLVRLGDWIEIPKYGADGDVVDITLQTIKVQNWDKTITTVPIYALVSDSFKNWRGMTDSGGRRIKRSVNIDMRSVKFCDQEMIKRFRRYSILNEYVEKRTVEIDAFNKEHRVDTSEVLNGRRMTNLGTFRAYVAAYLRNNPKVHDEMTFLVRQLQPTAQGIPMEIYVFSNDQVWGNYENIQADIFDHLLAVLPLFELEVFQDPSGADLKRIAESLVKKPE